MGDRRLANWQVVAIVVAGGIGALFLVFSLWMMAQPAGEGEVGTILHGGFIVLGLVAAVFFAALTVWFLFWQIKWLRWIGILALIGMVIYAAFGRQVQGWLGDQRMQRMDERAALQRDVEAQVYEQMRGSLSAPDKAIALRTAYMLRVNERDLHDGSYTNGWDTFGYVHAIYTLVFFDHERNAQYDNQHPPYAELYCSMFEDEFGALVATPEQRARAARACPEVWD